MILYGKKIYLFLKEFFCAKNNEINDEIEFKQNLEI